MVKEILLGLQEPHQSGNVKYSKAALQAIETNPVSCTQRVSGELAFHSLMSLVSFITTAKASGAAKLCLMLPKYCKTFDSP